LNPLPENACRRFLLGIASEEEQSLVEDAVLADELDASFLLHAEDGLIDDYLHGSLTHEEQTGFKTHFLSTEERRQRHAFASALMEYARRQPAEELSGGWAFLLHSIRARLSWKQVALAGAAASVLLAVLAGFQQLQLRRQGQIASEARNELTRLRAALDSRSSGTAQPGGPSTDSFVNPQSAADLMPAIEFAFSTRSVYPPSLRIPSHAQFVRINLKLSMPLAIRYREVLVASNGEHLWAQEFPASIVAATKESTIVLPTSILPPGIYHLLLETASADDHFKESEDWVFLVAKESS
jgi:hypothetical protein